MDDFFEMLFSWTGEILFGALALSVVCGVWTQYRHHRHRQKAFELMGLSQKHLARARPTENAGRNDLSGVEAFERAKDDLQSREKAR